MNPATDAEIADYGNWADSPGDTHAHWIVQKLIARIEADAKVIHVIHEKLDTWGCTCEECAEAVLLEIGAIVRAALAERDRHE